MNFIRLLIIFFFFSSCTGLKIEAADPDPIERVHYNQNNQLVSSEEFQQILKNKNNNVARWDYMRDGKQILTLSSPQYEIYEVDYEPFLKNLRKITGKNLPDDTIFLLGYWYADDLCTTEFLINWPETKHFLTSEKERIEKENERVIFLKFLEEGASLSKNPQSEGEYFFQDENGFLRKSIFKHPAFCGSFAIIKPNGQALVRNGGYNLKMLIQHLKPENWNLLFGNEK